MMAGGCPFLQETPPLKRENVAYASRADRAAVLRESLAKVHYNLN